MTSAILTPWWRDRSPVEGVSTGSALATDILDFNHSSVVDLAREVEDAGTDEALLRSAHGSITARVRPVYSVKETRACSRVLALGRGSCSQRMALLEAVARSRGIATRVRGLLVDGRFWYARFPRLKVLVPESVLLAWPQFFIGGSWLDVSEVFGTIEDLACGTPGFTNADGETLFEALSRTAVDWDGRTGHLVAGSGCDLSSQVIGDLGLYDSRDALFDRQGETLSWVVRTLAEPILGRWTP